MRPQGFLGRNFAQRNAAILQVPDDPSRRTEDDVVYALSLLGSDTIGNYILGEAAYRLFLAEAQTPRHFLTDEEVLDSYARLALEALSCGVVGSFAGGNFPSSQPVACSTTNPRMCW